VLSVKTRRQDFAVHVLSSHLKHARLAHTYLFTGEAASGKEDVAMDFACALNCEQQNFFRDCECLSCSKTRRGLHPDIQWVGKDLDVRSIKIEEVREVINTAAMKPYEGKWKVFILNRAERLTTEASNAFLKTLEEPPAHTIFTLLVETKAYLLETIQSRSFEIRMKPLDGAEATAEDADRVRGVLAMAGDWDDYLRSYQEKPREELKTILNSLTVCLSDTLRRKAGRESSESLPVHEWVEAINTVIETREAVDENANQKLALTRLAMKLGKMIPVGGVRL
jgi:hypothetical protein